MNKGMGVAVCILSFATMQYGQQNELRSSGGRSKFGAGLSLRDSGRLLHPTNIDLDHLFNYMIKCIDGAVEKKMHPEFPAVIAPVKDAPDIQRFYSMLAVNSKKQVMQNKYLNELNYQDFLTTLHDIYEDAWVYYGTKVALNDDRRAMFFPIFQAHIASAEKRSAKCHATEKPQEPENQEGLRAEKKDIEVRLHLIGCSLSRYIEAVGDIKEIQDTKKAQEDQEDAAKLLEGSDLHEIASLLIDEDCNFKILKEKRSEKIDSQELTEKLAVLVFKKFLWCKLLSETQISKDYQDSKWHKDVISTLKAIVGAVQKYDLTEKVEKQLLKYLQQ